MFLSRWVGFSGATDLHDDGNLLRNGSLVSTCLGDRKFCIAHEVWFVQHPVSGVHLQITVVQLGPVFAKLIANPHCRTTLVFTR